ncbi:hypothetical protein BXZ70DRAFT_927267 [Cristinia sonorae]|uniref:Acetyl-CoA synthetase-like protein n=1 Tax=Cristinia sonorae TaxID=1940300 RepID=A0A8K0US78_9AGAR|nr:hypothetical protein BXZ70DRAFT_927267 [Cristinia sonorae]
MDHTRGLKHSMSPKLLLPPLDGSIPVLPGWVDFHAEYNPSSLWAVFPSQGNTEVESITFFEYAQATHRVAHSLRPNRSGKDGEIVAILIHCDSILYLALIVGMVRAGFKPFPMSPRNSPEGVCSMLEKTGCRKVVVQPALSALSAAVQFVMAQKGEAIELVQLPELHAIFPTIGAKGSERNVDPYPENVVAGKQDDIVLYLHSSGSTGFPKPIPQTNTTILQWASCDCLRICGREHHVRWAAAALPSFHTLAIFMQLYAPLSSGEYVGLYAPQSPAPPIIPTPQNVLEVAQVTGCDGIFSIPAFIEVWSQSPAAVKFLSSLKILGFAGGPLSDANGAKLAAAGVRLFSVYGGTEFGSPSRVFDVDDSQGLDSKRKTSQDWAWMQFSAGANPVFVPQGDGTYELHLMSGPRHQPAIQNLPDSDGYATSDLWEPHPTKQGLWRIVGRTDDVIVLGSGEKIVPIPQESFLGSLPFVNGAIMFGRGKNQAGVLIEPRPDFAFHPMDERGVRQMKERIWPYIEGANALAPSFARIFRDLIIFTDPAKPMMRAPKGTVIRKMVLAHYEGEIEELYSNLEGNEEVDPPTSWDVASVEEWLLCQASTVSNGRELDSTVDIFAQGFDSLSVTFLRNRIINALRSSVEPSIQKAASRIPHEIVFTHPTLEKLAFAVVQAVGRTEQAVERAPKDVVEEINLMIDKYSAGMPEFTFKGEAATHSPVVLLTGSTGSLGTHILVSLLSDPRIQKIYTLDRGTDPIVRLESSFKSRGLPVDLLQSPKLVTLAGDLSKPGLGLEPKYLEEVVQSVTHIVHNAWKLDFNLSLSSFESHVAGTRGMIDFCALCKKHVKILFSSSISGAQHWDVRNGAVPEDVLMDPAVAGGTGYGSSKYVAERLLANARARGLETTSVRIGQISGSTITGAWNSTDWVPIMIQSSISMGALPILPGNISWIPVDVASRFVLDSILSTESLPAVVNLVHPHPVPWQEVFTAIKQVIGGPLELVPFDDWVSRLEAQSAYMRRTDLKDVPAIKLLRFFRNVGNASNAVPLALYAEHSVDAGGQPHFDNRKAQNISETLRNAARIDAGQVKLWVDSWKAGPWSSSKSD